MCFQLWNVNGVIPNCELDRKRWAITFCFPLFPQGVLLGLSNTAGVLAGVFGTAATGYILQHG
jgi:hypothetical protein